MGSRNGNSLPPPSPPPPPPLLFTSSLNFICATLAGMRTLKKNTLSTRQQLRRSHVASRHLEGGKSALSNTNMAKAPRHSRGTPRPLPSLARWPNIPAVTCGPLPGAGDGPQSEGGTAVRAKEEITESTVEMFLLDHRTHLLRRQRGGHIVSSPPAPYSRGLNGEQNPHPKVLPVGPAFPTLQNLPGS